MKNIPLFFLIIIGCTLVDQGTKALAQQYLADKGELNYLGGFAKLIFVENTGAAYSLGEGLTGIPAIIVLLVLPCIIVGTVGFYAISRHKLLPTTEMLALSFIFAGGIGNLFDRIYRNRHVVDFMNLGIGNIRTGIFNFADVFLCFGVGLMFAIYFTSGYKPKA